MIFIIPCTQYCSSTPPESPCFNMASPFETGRNRLPRRGRRDGTRCDVAFGVQGGTTGHDPVLRGSSAAHRRAAQRGSGASVGRWAERGNPRWLTTLRLGPTNINETSVYSCVCVGIIYHRLPTSPVRGIKPGLTDLMFRPYWLLHVPGPSRLRP